MIDVKVKRLSSTAQLPSQGSSLAAGYDLYANIDSVVNIPPHTTKKIGTGLSFELPDDYYAAIYARSGLATNLGIRPANCVGICDPDYRGEYIVALHNDSEYAVWISPQERIAQVIFVPRISCNFQEVDDLSSTDRGAGGFGSSGTH